jgi:hypothetical protein
LFLKIYHLAALVLTDAKSISGEFWLLENGSSGTRAQKSAICIVKISYFYKFLELQYFVIYFFLANRRHPIKKCSINLMSNWGF